MSETLLDEIESQESRLEKKRLERLARDRLDRDMREHLERELLEKERRARFARERAELLSEKEGFTIRESCHIIGAGRSSVYEALNAGELTAVKLGRRTIILKRELLRFLSELPAANFGIKQPDALESRPAGSGEVPRGPRSPKVKQRSAAVNMSAQT
jgi:excisionase family DNA binding protein